jgi:hypothetical protein
MRKIIIATALAISLSGCARTISVDPSGGGLVIGNTPIDAEIQQVRDIASKACGFLPAVETVASLIGMFTSGGPIVSTASAIADAICKKVTTAGVNRRGVRVIPSIVGVSRSGAKVVIPIEGKFVPRN